MGELTPSLAAEAEALREAYAALNRNDVPATVKAFDPQIEWTERELTHYRAAPGRAAGRKSIKALSTPKIVNLSMDS